MSNRKHFTNHSVEVRWPTNPKGAQYLLAYGASLSTVDRIVEQLDQERVKFTGAVVFDGQDAIHPQDEEALQTIDAAVFTGDPEIIRERLTYFIERWQKALER